MTKNKIKKLIQKKCYFCEIDDIDLLDVHRIVPGKDGGKYVKTNEIVVCKHHHAKIHAEKIKILGQYFCSNGCWVINYIDENGQETIK